MDLPEVDDWFAAEDLGQGISRLREPYVDPLIQANVYFVRGESRDLVIDSGTGIAALRPCLPVMRAEPVAVATHGHYDHVGGMAEFAARLVHEAEAGDLGRDDPLAVLLSRRFPAAIRQFLGSAVPECLVTAVPRAGFDPASYRPARSARKPLPYMGGALTSRAIAGTCVRAVGSFAPARVGPKSLP